MSSNIGSEKVIVEQDEAPPVCQPKGGIARTLRLYLWIGTIVLLINIFWLAWGLGRYKTDALTGTIFEGKCHDAKSLDRWLHLLINILSTLVLMGSNIFMSVSNSPSRVEVDNAHRQGRYLNIGLLSFRNLCHISRRKAAICILLAVTSAPFHLFYNALVFSSISANEYAWVMAPAGYTVDNVTSGAFAQVRDQWDTGVPVNASNSFAKNVLLKSLDGSYNRYTTQQCFRTYVDSFRASRRNVVLLTNNEGIRIDNKNLSEFFWGYAKALEDYKTVRWLCQKTHDPPILSIPQGCKTADCAKLASPSMSLDQCNPSTVVGENTDDWRIFNDKISGCMVEETEEVCALRFSFLIMGVMIFLSLIKLIAMLFISAHVETDNLLTCVGDAAASFLRHPDETSTGICLASREKLQDFWPERCGPQIYDGKPKRWFSANSKMRYLLFTILVSVCLTGVIAGIVTWSEALRESDVPSWSDTLKLGFGTANSFAIDSFKGLVNPRLTTEILLPNVLFANAPQVFLSMIILGYSGILNSMFVARDWNKFSEEAQGLIVASPRGQQRGSWMLGVPWKYGVSFLGLQTLVHWLISQSVFPVQISVHAANKAWSSNREIVGYGYSLSPLYCTLIAGVLILVSTFAISARTLKGGPPIASTCSAAISAACHADTSEDEYFVFKRLKWGAVKTKSSVGHCTFVTEEVWKAGMAGIPEEGKVYA